jgi:hypothetical protein
MRRNASLARKSLISSATRCPPPALNPVQDNVAALLSFPLPHTIKQLQALLELVNFYRRFNPAAEAVLKTLTDCLRGGRAGSEKLQWTEPMLQAVSKAKAAVVTAMTLTHPAVGAELSLVVDKSADHVGAALLRNGHQGSCIRLGQL